MVLEARLRIRHAGCFTQRLAPGAQLAQIGGDRDAAQLVLQGADDAQAASFLRHVQDATGRVPEVVGRSAAGLVLRARAPHATVAAVHAHGCTVVWPVLCARGEEEMRVLASSRERLDALLRALGALGAVELDGVGEVAPDANAVSVPLGDITTALTERQLDVLQRAIGAGYYESPRRTSTEALAAEFGVTRSTLEEHLRKAERRVLEGFAGVLAAQPVLASAAARRPGRPPGARSTYASARLL